MNTRNVIIGASVCLAAGAVLGLLYAPDKGKATRRRIYRKGEQYTDALRDGLSGIVDGMSHTVETVMNDAEKLAKNVNKKKMKLFHN